MHDDDDDREEDDLLGWRTGRRRWMRLDYHRAHAGQGEHVGKGPKNYMRSDERILHDLCERLQDAALDASEVDVHVTDGEVVLDGVVNDRFTKRALEDIAFTVRGVRDCHNRLRLASAADEQQPHGPAHDHIARVGVPRS